MPGDGLALQSPIQVCQKPRLDAKASLGRGGHLWSGTNQGVGHFCLGKPGALVPFGARWRRGFLPG